MNKFLPEKVRNIPGYLSGKAETRIRLDSNESFVEMPPRLRLKIADIATETELNRYPDPLASDLCEAYAGYIGLDRQYIAAGNGSDEMLQVLISGFLENGQKLLIMPPDFGMYNFYASVMGVQVLEYPRNEDFSLNLDGAREYAKENGVSMVLFSNPNNPSGNLINRAEILRFAEKTEALVVVDEAYMDFSSETVSDMAPKMENLIVLRTLSKAVGLAALRAGFALSNREIIEGILKVKSTFNVNSLTNRIGAEVLRDKDFVAFSNGEVIKNTRELHDRLLGLSAEGKFRVFPTAANFVLTEWEDSGYVLSFLNWRGISVRKLEKFIRISTGSRSENDELLAAIKVMLNQMQ